MTTNKSITFGCQLKTLKQNIDTCNYDDVNRFFLDNKYENIDEKNKNGYISLKIRYFIKIDNNEDLSYIINNFNLMKRDYISYCIYIYSNNIEKSKKIFLEKVIPNCKLESNDIDKLIDNNCIELLKLLNNYFVNCTKKSNVKNEDKLNKVYLSQDIINNVNSFYKEKTKEKYYNGLIEKIKDIDCIVDGGNISHINGGKCDYKYIDRISKNINKKYNKPLYIFHHRHKKILKEFLKNVNHFITPVNEYDDYYIIIAVLLSNKPVITNDNFKDHIFDILSIYL